MCHRLCTDDGDRLEAGLGGVGVGERATRILGATPRSAKRPGVTDAPITRTVSSVDDTDKFRVIKPSSPSRVAAFSLRIEKIRIRELGVIPVLRLRRMRRVQRNEPCAPIAEGQRTKVQGIDDAVDDGVGGHADGERRHGGHSESSGATKRANREPEILQHRQSACYPSILRAGLGLHRIALISRGMGDLDVREAFACGLVVPLPDSRARVTYNLGACRSFGPRRGSIPAKPFAWHAICMVSTHRPSRFRASVIRIRLDTPKGRFVLKIANGAESRAMLEAQNAAMSHVSARGGRCPTVVPAAGGAEILESDGHFIRLLSWIPGAPLGDVQHPSAALFEDLGRRVGELGRALADFDHPAAHRQFHWDLAAAFSTIAGHLPIVGDAAWRTFLSQEVEQLERRHAPERLRRSVIHNDANDYNVLVDVGDNPRTRYQRVAGIIDFGDIVHSFTIADLAVAIAYAVLDKADPLRVAAQIVSGYHATYPLPEEELSQLFDLVRLRLCLSACIAAHQEPDRPMDEYSPISQTPIRRTLPRLSRFTPDLQRRSFARPAECALCRLPIACWPGSPVPRGPGSCLT